MILREPRKVAVICLVFLLFWTVFWTIRGRAETVSGSFTVYPQEDTEIMENLPNTQVWENLTEVQTSNWTGYDRRFYMKFNFTDEYRGTLAITGGMLRIHYNDSLVGYVGNEIDIYDTNNESWFDHNITWNNAPPLDDLEVYDSLHSSQASWYTFFLSEDLAVTGLQNAYDTNTTRTFVLAHPLMYAFMMWNTVESTSSKPYLVVYYEQTLTGESTLGRPAIERPTPHTLKFFPIADSVVQSWNVTANTGTENDTQVEALVSAGYIAIEYLKFNFSIPDRIDNNLNSQNFTLTNVNWYANRLVFKPYVSFLPTDISYRGFWVTQGILRTFETSWFENNITWSNAPTTRGYTCFQTWIGSEGYQTFDIQADEDFIRYTVANDTTYTIVFGVDQRASRSAYANFHTRESDFSLPYVEMEIVTEPSALEVTIGLTWTTADEYLANTWNLSPFIAGHLLCAIVMSVTIVPIGWIARSAHEKKKEILTLLLFSLIIELTAFLIFTWLNIGIYVILLIILILFAGGVLKS